MQDNDAVIHALLGAGTRYEGKLFFDGRVRIDGDFEGDVLSDGLLVVGEEGTVKGVVRVGTLIVRGGTIEGEIHATELVELHTPAEVRGNIHTPALFIDKGVVFDGSCVMGQVHELEASEPPKERTSTAGAAADDSYSDQPTST